MPRHVHRDKVVVVHGRDAAMEIPGTFEPQLEQAVRFGLQRVGYEHWSCVPVAVPFYGKLWRPDNFLPAPVFLPGPGGRDTRFRGLRPGEILEGAIEFADRWGLLSGTVLELLLADTKEYLTRDGLRQATDALVTEACADADVVVLVGFSMGSLVGYHVLMNDQPEAVRYFVTCGSPIGSQRFYSYMKQLFPGGVKFPPKAQMWANIWNDQDTATKVNDLTPLFPSDSEGLFVQSARSYGRAPELKNPFAAHNANDYLSSKALGAAVATALRVG